MEQLSEVDIKLHECSSLSQLLNQAIEEFNQITQEMRDKRSCIVLPFGLENTDYDAGMEGLIEKSKNVLSKIKNFIIKLWTAIKELLDKVLHVFDGTLRKLKAYKETFKGGVASKNEQAFYDAKVTCYPKVVMQRRIECLLNEINMRWTESDGTPNAAERESLDPIGFHVRVNDGKVTASYNGVYPKLDTLAGHGYTFDDVGILLNNAVDMYEKFPQYKENLIKAYNNSIEARYKRDSNDEQKSQTILADRVQYMAIHKTIQFVLKDIREIGKETLAICNVINS